MARPRTIDWDKIDHIILKMWNTGDKKNIDSRVGRLFNMPRQMITAHRIKTLKLYLKISKDYIDPLKGLKAQPKKLLHGQDRLLAAVKNKQSVLKYNKTQMKHWLNEKTGNEWLIEMASYSAVPIKKIMELI
jgi:hypothetical protein